MILLKSLLVAVCLLQIFNFVQSESFYSISAPGTLRPGLEYHVAVSIHQADGPCKIKVGLIGPSLDESKTVEVQPYSTETAQFTIPKNLKTGDYNLTAEGLSGITFKNTTSLNFDGKTFSVFIQTDKATYKPGDKIQFRVLVLDQNLHPYQDNDQKIDIIINDGAKNRIKQFTGIKLKNGIFSGELQLSEFPVLGNWEIDVQVGSESKKMKSIEIAKYVLPKFEVSVEAPKDVALDEGFVKFTVRAKYTYGKPLQGKAVITVKPSYAFWGSETENEFVKHVPIDGKAHVEVDFEKDLKLKTSNNQYIPPMQILAVVEEELTGLKQNSTATFNLHRDKYTFEPVDNVYTFWPEKPLTYRVVVKNLDGSPVQDTKNSLILKAEGPRYFRSTGEQNNVDKVYTFESKLNEHGIATFELKFPNDNTSFYSLSGKYLGVESFFNSLSKFEEKTGEYFTAEVQTKKPKLDKDVSIKISSNEPLKYFFYQVTARGDIIMSDKIEVPEKRKYHVFKLKPTFAMIPKATLFVYFVRNGDLVFEETTINFENQFENKIEIEAPEMAKPGEDINLKITTDPDSHVGLLGVDQSVLLLKGGNDLNKDEIFSELSSFDAQIPWRRGFGRNPGASSGLVAMTNAHFPFNEVLPRPVYFGLGAGADVQFGIRRKGSRPIVLFAAAMPQLPQAAIASSSIPVTIRKNFVETWIWNNFDIKNENDSINVSKKVPDTITSWVITGFSLNSKTGLALTEEATKLRVFQPFFASTNLPYSVKRGEVISIPVIIFNYLEKTLDATVTLDNSNKEFEFTEATNEVEEKKIDKIQRSKTVTVPGNSGKTVSFLIRPMKVGHITLKITATSPLAGDAIHQILKIEPEGVTEYVNKAFLINLNDKAEQSESVDIAIPKEAVPNSEYVEVSVVGDLLGPTIQNLDKLVRMPYGCGEQNMVNFVPNILVLKYLTSIRMLSPTIEEKAKKFLEIGYQRELTYKHDDGSYSAFGKSDKSGSTWLTAYVAKSFHQAAKFTEIDPKVLSEALTFLAGTQSESGKFVEVGKVIDHQHSGESEKEIGLTAFVLLAFLENFEAIPKFQDNINKGLKYISENIDSTDDLYALSISLFALQLAKNDKAPKLLEKLESLAKTEGDRKWWSKAPEEPENKKQSWWTPSSVDVEITSYILQAILENHSPDTTLPIIKWLISQRNSNGGFASTQDTVVGLQALNKFAESTGSGQAEMDVEIEDDQGKKDKLSVNNENSLVLQTYVLPTTTQKVDLKAKGKGNCLVQVSYKYNIANKEEKPRFIVKPTVIDSGKPEKLVLEVCINFVPIETEKESNMAVMEVNLPSGFTADSDSFDALKNIESVKRVETKKDETVVIVYYDNLGENEICGKIEAIKTHAVAKQKPVAVIVYDYYDNVKRGTEYYSIESSLCDICQGDDCGEGCSKQN